jgi:hypothetical protein
MSNLLQPTLRTARPSFAKRLAHSTLALACAAGLAMGTAHAASVSYQLTDLADVTPGEDLWQIDYTLSGPLDTFQGVTLYFAAGAYAQLTLLGNDSPADIDVAPPIDPDAGLGTDGLVSVLAFNTLDASFQGHFGLSMVWLGSGKPGAQAYDVFDDSFNVIATGTTTPAVPEPTTWLLLLAGLSVAGLAHRARGTAV